MHDASNDWVILLLDQAPDGIRPRQLGRPTATALKSLERQILVPSYARDVANADALTVDPASSIRDVVLEALVHDCRGLLGASGAPLLLRHRGWYAVVGIHSGAMVARDEERRTVKLIGNSAIGAWAFTDAVHALVQRLNSGSEPGGAGSHAY